MASPDRAPAHHSWTHDPFQPPASCFEFVDLDDGTTQRCLAPPIRSGWCHDNLKVWRRVEACADHADKLVERPER